MEQPTPDVSLAQIVAALNSEGVFASVAEAILRAACQQIAAAQATLLGSETDTAPLLRATYSHPSSAPNTSPPLQLPLHSSGQLVGLLELRGLGPEPLTEAQREQLDILANLAALLIQREYCVHSEDIFAAKLRQFDLHKEEYLHLVSHQLRTPLTSIKGFAQLLGRPQRASNPEAVSRYSQTILQESIRLNTMVNNLMELSRMEVAIVGIRAVPLSLNAAVAQALDVASLGPQTSSDYTNPLPACSCDADALQHALSVLFTHLSHTPNQQLTIRTLPVANQVTLRIAPASDDWPNRLSDDPQTITLAQAVDSSEAHNPAMSLYIVRNLIQAMGGSFTLERNLLESSPPHSYIINLPLIVSV